MSRGAAGASSLLFFYLPTFLFQVESVSCCFLYLQARIPRLSR